jgi:hypothetical protein
MTGVQHISMRVPWRDQPWDDKVCGNPRDNSSCLLLKNIGAKRDDDWEVQVAGTSFADLPQVARLPCLSERGTFMSLHGYTLTKEHPYQFNKALKGHLNPTAVSVPPYAFEALPFRWLSRSSVEEELWVEGSDYRAEREDDVDRLIGFKPGWLMDGRNQRTMIEAFFSDVVADESLVLVYLKHSPLQEESSQRLLVGAALVTGIQAPPMWNQSGEQPFDSSMWETIVSHSLRPNQQAGILLPYQQLIDKLDAGEDVSQALAWAPVDAADEFSYVTEHVSDDTAIAALNALRSAAEGMRALGIMVEQSALHWVESQVDRLWQLRGPAPGLAAVLAYLGSEQATRVAAEIARDSGWNEDPWSVVERGLAPKSELGARLGLRPSVGQTWRGQTEDQRRGLKVLSAMDLRREQVNEFVNLDAGGDALSGLAFDPYLACVRTYRTLAPISLATVDQACFPAVHVDWLNLVESVTDMDDPGDPRRLGAFLVEVLESLALTGDTVVAESEAVTRASEIVTTRPCPLSLPLLRANKLNAAQVGETEQWTPLVGAELAEREPAYKLKHLDQAGRSIRMVLESRRTAKRFPPITNSRACIDAAIGAIVDPTDPEDELARTEKAEGLIELVSSRLSVLIGAAGTGKTTLLRALVAQPAVQQDGVLLLAPTGKARVQLQTKVGSQAQTLASFLVKKGGFDPQTGAYLPVETSKRDRVGLVVIDEASMLTEDMLASVLSAITGVKRLILVGDHRQLPPIGAGRPFVDVVEWLRPGILGETRVGPGYVELTVSMRQRGPDGSRDDVALARWFGGEVLDGDADRIWQELRNGQESATLAYRSWTSAGVVDSLLTAVEEELGLTAVDDLEKAFKLTYGGQLSDDGKYVNWNLGSNGAGAHCEDWQILSATRSRVFGTVEINRLMKRRYRQGDLKWSQNRFNWRPPRALGPEQIVYGDKVMQTRNNSRAKGYPDGAGQDYLANGEIGVVVGTPGKSPKWVNVEFSSQLGAKYGYRPSGGEDPDLELAWAVTVHKSQGSEFGTTFLVLPSRVQVSRELLYTALTRQTKKVVILHEGTVDDLFRLASPGMSETARRMTDLFRKPDAQDIQLGEGMARFDANLIHVAPGGVIVRSKNEIIIASILEQASPGNWQYEKALTIDGITKYPDFTVQTDLGDEVVWEHLGMMNNPRYAANWAAKKRWYLDSGYRPFDQPELSAELGVLVWTDDSAGVDLPAWEALAAEVMGGGA